MEVIKNKVVIGISQSEFLAIVVETMKNDPKAEASIKRIVTQAQTITVPEMPAHSNVTIGETLEDGSIEIICKKPVVTVAKEEVEEPAPEEEEVVADFSDEVAE